MAQSPMETLVTGCGLIEGPRVDEENRLYFSDVHKGGVYRRWPDGRTETLVPKRRGVGGIALHEDGGVVVSGRNVCHVKDGISTVIHTSDRVLGYNDMQPDREGRLYVGEIRYRIFENAPMVPGALVRLEKGGKAQDVYGDVTLANGIGFSPDGTRLYHSDTRRNQILVHRRSEPDDWVDRRTFAEITEGGPDGLAVDSEGFVWVAAYGGGCVLRFDPGGALDRRLQVPARAVTSLCFGGADLCDLYITSADNTADPSLGGSIFRTRVETPGQATPRVRI